MEEENQKSSTLVEQQQPDENESGCDASQAESNPHLDNSEPAIDDKQMTEAASIDKAISDDSEKSPSLSDENQTSEVEPAMQGTLQTAEAPSVQSPPAPEAFPVQDKMEASSEVPAIQQETNINAAVDGSPAQTPSEPETASVSQHPDSEPAVKAIVVPAKLDDCESAASEAIYEGFEDPPAMSNVHQAPDDIQETSPVGKVSPDPQQSDHIEDALPTQSKSVKEAIPAHHQPETDSNNNGQLVPLDSQTSLSDRRHEALISLYHEKIRKVSEELDSKYEHFVTNPNSHPMHKDEWKKFYNKQSYKIAQHDGNFCYLPAWASYWKRLMSELKYREYRQFESQLRAKLCISPEPHGCKRKVDGLSDISDDELQLQSPKRQKYEEYEPQRPTSKYRMPKIHRTFTEIDRMTIAYNMAFKHFQEGKRTSPKELEQLMKEFVERNNYVVEYQEAGSRDIIEPKISQFTDKDLILLHENYFNLSSFEQERFDCVLNLIEARDPDRFELLDAAMKAATR